MKIIDIKTMQDGTKIQIEDWNADYSCFPPCGTLAAYPTAKATDYNSIFHHPEQGKKCRLAFYFANEDLTRQAFDDLLNGKKTFRDFKENAEHPHYLDLI